MYSLCLVSTGVFCYILQRFFPLKKVYSFHISRSLPRLFKDQFWMWFNFIVVPWGVFSLFERYIDLEFTDLKNQEFMMELSDMPMAIRILFFLIVIDLIDYVMHRLLHKFDFLWYFHRMHHGIKDFYWERNQVFHPMEILFYGLIELIPKVVLLGIMSGEEWVWLALIRLAIGNFAHTSTRVRLGFLEKIINNPATHCWHHSKRFGVKVNFGVTFVFWDVFFGSYRMPSDDWPRGKMGFEGSEYYEPAGIKALKFWK